MARRRCRWQSANQTKNPCPKGRELPCFHLFSPMPHGAGLCRYRLPMGGGESCERTSCEPRVWIAAFNHIGGYLFILRRSRTARQHKNPAGGGTAPHNLQLFTHNFPKQKNSHPPKDESLVFPPYFIRASLRRTFIGTSVPPRCNGRLPCGIPAHGLLLTQAPECTSIAAILSAPTHADSLRGQSVMYSFPSTLFSNDWIYSITF